MVDRHEFESRTSRKFKYVVDISVYTSMGTFIHGILYPQSPMCQREKEQTEYAIWKDMIDVHTLSAAK